MVYYFQLQNDEQYHGCLWRSCHLLRRNLYVGTDMYVRCSRRLPPMLELVTVPQERPDPEQTTLSHVRDTYLYVKPIIYAKLERPYIQITSYTHPRFNSEIKIEQYNVIIMRPIHYFFNFVLECI